MHSMCSKRLQRKRHAYRGLQVQTYAAASKRITNMSTTELGSSQALQTYFVVKMKQKTEEFGALKAVRSSLQRAAEGQTCTHRCANKGGADPRSLPGVEPSNFRNENPFQVKYSSMMSSTVAICEKINTYNKQAQIRTRLHQQELTRRYLVTRCLELWKNTIQNFHFAGGSEDFLKHQATNKKSAKGVAKIK